MKGDLLNWEGSTYCRFKSFLPKSSPYQNCPSPQLLFSGFRVAPRSHVRAPTFSTTVSRVSCSQTSCQPSCQTRQTFILGQQHTVAFLSEHWSGCEKDDAFCVPHHAESQDGWCRGKAIASLEEKQQPLLATSTLLQITNFDKIKSLTNYFIMQALIANGTIS